MSFSPVYDSFDACPINEPAIKRSRPTIEEELNRYEVLGTVPGPIRTPEVLESNKPTIASSLADLLNNVGDDQEEVFIPIVSIAPNLPNPEETLNAGFGEQRTPENAGFNALEYMNRNFNVPNQSLRQMRQRDHGDSDSDSDSESEFTGVTSRDSDSDAVQAKILKHYFQQDENKRYFNAGKLTKFIREELKKELILSDSQLVRSCTSKKGLLNVLKDAGNQVKKHGHAYSSFRFATLPEDIRRAICEVFDFQKLGEMPSSNGIGDLFAKHCAYRDDYQIWNLASRIKSYQEELIKGSQKYSLANFMVYIGVKRDPLMTPRSIKTLSADASAIVIKNPPHDEILDENVKFAMFDNVGDLVDYARAKLIYTRSCEPIITSTQLPAVYMLPLKPEFGRTAGFKNYTEFETFLKERGYIP